MLKRLQLFGGYSEPFAGHKAQEKQGFSSLVQGQGKDQELGAEVDEGDTSPEGGEGLFYIHPRTNQMALENSGQPPGEVSLSAREEIGQLRSLPRLDPVPSSSVSEMDESSKA